MRFPYVSRRFKYGKRTPAPRSTARDIAHPADRALTEPRPGSDALPSEVVGVELGEAAPLVGQIIERENRRNRADRDAGSTIDALHRIDVDHVVLGEVGGVLLRMDAIDRAG